MIPAVSDLLGAELTSELPSLFGLFACGATGWFVSRLVSQRCCTLRSNPHLATKAKLEEESAKVSDDDDSDDAEVEAAKVAVRQPVAGGARRRAAKRSRRGAEVAVVMPAALPAVDAEAAAAPEASPGLAEAECQEAQTTVAEGDEAEVDGDMAQTAVAEGDEAEAEGDEVEGDKCEAAEAAEVADPDGKEPSLRATEDQDLSPRAAEDQGLAAGLPARESSMPLVSDRTARLLAKKAERKARKTAAAEAAATSELTEAAAAEAAAAEAAAAPELTEAAGEGDEAQVTEAAGAAEAGAEDAPLRAAEDQEIPAGSPNQQISDRTARLFAKKAERKARKAAEKLQQDAAEKQQVQEEANTEQQLQHPQRLQLQPAGMHMPEQLGQLLEEESAGDTVSDDAMVHESEDDAIAKKVSWADLEEDADFPRLPKKEASTSQWEPDSEPASAGNRRCAVSWADVIAEECYEGRPRSRSRLESAQTHSDPWMMPFGEMPQEELVYQKPVVEPILSEEGHQLYTDGQQVYMLQAMDLSTPDGTNSGPRAIVDPSDPVHQIFKGMAARSEPLAPVVVGMQGAYGDDQEESESDEEALWGVCWDFAK